MTQATLAGLGSFRTAYDYAGRMWKQWGAGTSVPAATDEGDVDAAYSYDPVTGQKTDDDLLLPLGGDIDNHYTYDAAGRLSVATIGGLAATHTFDAAGSLKRIVEGGLTTDFSYDAGGRLTQTTGAATTVYQWNAAQGWRTSQGPSAGSQPITYAYTAAGRLSAYENAAASPAISATYAYDAAGQRTRSVVAQGSTTTTTDYRYEGLTLLGLSAQTSGGASWKIDYLYDEDGRPYGGVYREGAGQPVVFAMVTTDRGDVVELLDAAGAPFAAYRYDAWGNPTSSPAQGTGLISAALAAEIAARQILRYASYAYDAESGLYYCSARYYDPATRQWTTGDPAKADGEESAYQYCGGEPVGSTDPTGEERVDFAQEKWYPAGNGDPSLVKYTMVGWLYYSNYSSKKWALSELVFTLGNRGRPYNDVYMRIREGKKNYSPYRYANDMVIGDMQYRKRFFGITCKKNISKVVIDWSPNVPYHGDPTWTTGSTCF